MKVAEETGFGQSSESVPKTCDMSVSGVPRRARNGESGKTMGSRPNEFQGTRRASGVSRSGPPRDCDFDSEDRGETGPSSRLF